MKKKGRKLHESKSKSAKKDAPEVHRRLGKATG